MLPDAYALSAEDVARRFEVQVGVGRRTGEVEALLRRYGPNSLPEATRRSWLQRAVGQFQDFMILVLLGAAAISSVIGEISDTAAIVVIVVLNAAIGMVQEWRAERAIEALREFAVPQARALRDGHVALVDSQLLVPGDVVLLEAGDMVPADLRLHHAAQLRVDESALTGESVTVHKHVAALPAEPLALADRINMAFKGTLVTMGRASGIVVATGARTELGKIAGLMQDSALRSTPLQQRLAAFGKRLSLVVLAICVLVFVIGLARGERPGFMALTAISLAVAAIPEALPAVVTVLLALGARAMVRVNALVRQLASVETLGSVTTICADKTGTLTVNRMRVHAWHTWLHLPARDLWRGAALCNDAQYDAEEGRWIGDPTEVALVERAQADGTDVLDLRTKFARLLEYPFDPERKRMTTVHRAGAVEAGSIGVTKGAPESVLPLCTHVLGAHGPEVLDVQSALAIAQGMAEQGMRVLAVAQRQWRDSPPADAAAAERDLAFLGLIGLLDPPRPEARQSVAQCQQAGIVPVMITGDHPGTALAIARELGIADARAVAITGAELASVDDAALQTIVGRARVYARMDPSQKIRVVRALQARGEIVAMTGDGINDAPALRSADIGVAMGLRGTDVAREAAALVLLDDNFATIVAAVREGRRIFDNVRKFVRYAMTGNSGEIWTLFLAPLLGMPVPLLPIHILWVNLVTDGLPGLALAAEPAERGVMRRPPRPPGESIFAGGLWQHTLWVGLLIAGLCLGVQAWALAGGNTHSRTMVFTVLTLTQMAHVLAIRSERESLLTIGLRGNLPLLGAVMLTFALQVAIIYVPVLQPIFHTRALTPGEGALCIGCAVLVFAAVETEKYWRRR